MAIAIANVDFNGPAPAVKVLVGNLQRASYTIAIVPPDFDLTRSIGFVTADEPAEVDATHSVGPVWDQLAEGWFIVVFGGIASDTDPPVFPVEATLLHDGGGTAMTVSVTPGSSAATFIAAVELQ